MTSHTSSKTGWRRTVAGVVASGALAAGLIAGFGSGTASADVLDDIYAQYDTGAGGGQVSVLVHSAIKLRAAGFQPSEGNVAELEDGWARRPNQTALISALQQTVAYQKRSQARSAGQQTPTAVPPLSPGDALVGGPGISSNIPIG
jgi:hypothetical protein